MKIDYLYIYLFVSIFMPSLCAILNIIFLFTEENEQRKNVFLTALLYSSLFTIINILILFYAH